MRWTPGQRSSNIEDRRGQSLGLGGRTIGLGGGAILLILSLLFGRNLFEDVGSGPAVQTAPGEVGPVSESAEEKQLADFVSFVLDDAQQTWATVLPKYGAQYRDAKLVLFRDAVESGCGVAESAMGPFYCPLDKRVYLDVTFFREMEQRFRAGGEFAYAYVIAHEVGHHLQNVLGILPKVQQRQREVDRAGANQLSVRVELMADCLAGVWAMNSNERYKDLTQTDIQQAIAAASAIGDDQLQKRSQGYAVPDSFTHGSSEQRVRWFMTGFKSGQVKACDTFRTARL